MPVTEPTNKEEFRAFVTSPMEPDDTLAIKVRQLYIDTEKKQKIELETGLNDLRDIEKQQEYEEYLILQKQTQDAQQKLQHIQEMVDKAKDEFEKLKKQLEAKDNRIKRKYEKMNE